MLFEIDTKLWKINMLSDMLSNERLGDHSNIAEHEKVSFVLKTVNSMGYVLTRDFNKKGLFT